MIGYIYKIYNHINDKIYVGKTELTIDMRWKQHIQDSAHKDFPLYRAIRKYGINNFAIQLLEECEIEDLSNREIYWINFYDSYKNGYNATLGGDGKTLYNHSTIYALLLKGLNREEICAIVGCCPDVVTTVARKNNINLLSHSRNTLKQYAQNTINQLEMIDKITGRTVKIFEGSNNAANYLVNIGVMKTNNGGSRGHIIDAAKGKRKSAYGYYWRIKKE